MYDESWLIVDTETDGLRAPVHVVEIAAQKMRGWQREGESFRVLLNHDVPIDPAAQAVHGYTREYLRAHGMGPYEAHAHFREYAGDLPIVAFNLGFDWDQVLLPEYTRLGLPPVGRRGFCALSLARRVVDAVEDHRLETLKAHFGLNADQRSHRGRQDVETTTALFEQVMAPRLYQAAVYGFEAISEFSRRYPVENCLRFIEGDESVKLSKPAVVKKKVSYYLFLPPDRVVGPHTFDRLREWVARGTLPKDVQVCQEGTEAWVLFSDLPRHDFVTAAVKKRLQGSDYFIARKAWTEPATARQLMKLSYFDLPFDARALSKAGAAALLDDFVSIDPAREAAYQASPADADQLATLFSLGVQADGLTRSAAKAIIRERKLGEVHFVQA